MATSDYPEGSWADMFAPRDVLRWKKRMPSEAILYDEFTNFETTKQKEAGWDPKENE